LDGITESAARYDRRSFHPIPGTGPDKPNPAATALYLYWQDSVIKVRRENLPFLAIILQATAQDFSPEAI
jgi:hypothetical protein